MEKYSPEGQEDVAVKIIDYITEEKLKNGARLPSIRDLSGIMKLSQSAVRDGLLRTQTMGLVKVHPRAGTFVQSPNYSSFVEVFKKTTATVLGQDDPNLFSLIETRRLIEVEVVSRVAAQGNHQAIFPMYKAIKDMEECRDKDNQREFILADEDFHVSIARIAGNQVLVAILEALLTMLRPQRMSLVRSPKEMGYIEKVHWEIYKSIMKGEEETARAKIREHLNYQRRQLVDKVTDIPEDSSPEKSSFIRQE